MKKHRVFIAINLPKEVREKLGEYQKEWPGLPVRWTKPENLHITLSFLGYVADQDLPKVFDMAESMASKHRPFNIRLNKICYGPLDKKPPRMIWVVGESSEQLGVSLHITLARIRKWEWQRIEPEERPEIEKDIDLEFSVNSIEVMESALKRGGPEYTILKSFNL